MIDSLAMLSFLHSNFRQRSLWGLIFWKLGNACSSQSIARKWATSPLGGGLVHMFSRLESRPQPSKTMESKRAANEWSEPNNKKTLTWHASWLSCWVFRSNFIPFCMHPNSELHPNHCRWYFVILLAAGSPCYFPLLQRLFSSTNTKKVNKSHI